ncbi:MAG: O-antigen ligase family protein, partial [Bacillota bacterium]|nr:O-antigen ligase family protein [Bacillota bacterium]
LYTLLFVRATRDKEASLLKKIALGVLIALLIFNLIGSQSSGGYLGIGVAFILAIIVFNKQLIKWLKPLLVVILIIAIVMGCTFNRWWPEISGAVKSVLGIQTEEEVDETEKETNNGPGSHVPTIEYIETGSNTIKMSLNGEELVIAVQNDGDAITGMNISDGSGKVLDTTPIDGSAVYAINDMRFYEYATVALAYDGTNYFVQVKTGDVKINDYDWAWNFVSRDSEMYFYSAVTGGKLVKLNKVDTWGFKNNPGFGSGRGGIWAHSFPLLKDTIIIGTGADTYCAVYPQHDYASKWGTGETAAENLYLIVDKPHNMYLHAAIGTGCISLLALVALYGIYLVQSIKLFWKRDLENDFISFAGAGTFLGVTGFLVAGLVDDSTVSVMPLFYTFLGLGIAINMIIKRRDAKAVAK